MPEITLKDIEAVIMKAIRPLADDICEIKLTMHGNEGRTGVARDATRALEIVKEHETILRGKDKTSGMIKKINHLWFVASTGAIGLFWKVWEYLAQK